MYHRQCDEFNVLATLSGYDALPQGRVNFLFVDYFRNISAALVSLFIINLSCGTLTILISRAMLILIDRNQFNFVMTILL